MTEEEEQVEVFPGVVYGYIESLEAALPEGNEAIIELNFRKEARDITTKRENNLFIVNRRMRLPLHIKYDKKTRKMQEKYLVLKLFRITNQGERKQFGDYRINLQNVFRPSEMVVISDEARAKMSKKPIITLSFAAYYKSDPIPQEISGFTFEKRHPNQQEDSNSSKLQKTKSESHVTLLVNDPEIESDRELSRSVIANSSSFVNDSSDSFDEDITLQAIQLASQSSNQPKIDEFIVRNWFDLSKYRIGEPGFNLAKKLIDAKGRILNQKDLERVFSMLEDVRTTTKNEDSSIYFYSSTLTFYQNSLVILKKNKEIISKAQDLCYSAMDTAASIICPFLKKMFLDSLKYEVGSKEFNEILNLVYKKMSKYNTESLQFLRDFIYDEFDCIMSNSVITDKIFLTVGSVVIANSAISDFETKLKTQFNRFRQVILTVIANDNILENPESCKDLVPLISPTFIYFIYCMIKPDDAQPNTLDYKKIDNFARKMNVNFQTDISKVIMFKTIKKPLPTKCNEFKFSS